MSNTYTPLQPSQLSKLGQKVLIEFRKEWLTSKPPIPPAEQPGWPRTWNTQIENLRTQDLLVNSNNNFVSPVLTRAPGPIHHPNREMYSNRNVTYNQSSDVKERHKNYLPNNEILPKGPKYNQLDNAFSVVETSFSQRYENSQSNIGQSQRSVLLFDENDDYEEQERQKQMCVSVEEACRLYNENPSYSRSTDNYRSRRVHFDVEGSEATTSNMFQERYNNKHMESETMQSRQDSRLSPIIGPKAKRLSSIYESEESENFCDDYLNVDHDFNWPQQRHNNEQTKTGKTNSKHGSCFSPILEEQRRRKSTTEFSAMTSRPFEEEGIRNEYLRTDATTSNMPQQSYNNEQKLKRYSGLLSEKKRRSAISDAEDVCDEYPNVGATTANLPDDIEPPTLMSKPNFCLSPERTSEMIWLPYTTAPKKRPRRNKSIHNHSRDDDQERQLTCNKNVSSLSSHEIRTNRIIDGGKQRPLTQSDFFVSYLQSPRIMQIGNYHSVSNTSCNATSYIPTDEHCLEQEVIAGTSGHVVRAVPKFNFGDSTENLQNDSSDSRKSLQDLELGGSNISFSPINPNLKVMGGENMNLEAEKLKFERNLKKNVESKQNEYFFQSPLKRKQLAYSDADGRQVQNSNLDSEKSKADNNVTPEKKSAKRSIDFSKSDNRINDTFSITKLAEQRKITDMFLSKPKCPTEQNYVPDTTLQNEQTSNAVPLELYTVTFIKEKNLPDVEQQIFASTIAEVSLTIMYKEGFSQLNQPNSTKSEPCTPAGIMMRLAMEENIEYCYLSVIKPGQWTAANAPKFFLRKLFELPCPKLCHDTQAMFMFLIDVYGFQHEEVGTGWNFQDPVVGCWLLDPDNSSSRFEDISNQQLGQQSCVRVADRKSRVCKSLNTLSLTMSAVNVRLKQQQLWDLFLNMEMKLVPILAVMELRGITVDREKLHEIGTILEKRIMYLQEEAYIAAGKRFQLNSTQQLRAVLYDDLQLDKKNNIVIKETVGRGAKSTAGPMLVQLLGLHPLPGLVLEHRHLQKLKSTYVDAILQHVRTDTIFTTWEQTSAATGRLTSSNPNLQAVPNKPVSSLTDSTAKQGPEFGPLWLRSPYKPRAGCTLLAADFKHIEFRLFAHLAQDQRLLQLFQQPEDIFMALAKVWLGKQGQAPGELDRERTKRTVYAVMYGAGAGKLAEFLQVPLDEATAIISSFVGMFPALRIFPRRVISRCRSQGYLCSISGRRRLFPKISSPINTVRCHAERQAMNFVIQGSAADVCKAAMLQTEANLAQHRDLQARLLLQIHDELVWEVPDEHVERVRDIVRHTMEDTSTLCRGMAELSITLPVSVTVGSHWGDMKT